MQAERIIALAQRHAGLGLVIALVGILLLGVVNLWLLVRMRRLSRDYQRLTSGVSGESLEQTLYTHLDNVNGALTRTEAVAAACKALDERMTRCVQKVGFLRFDAFEDVGGQLSFALALLDGADNGFVLSSLHGRQETRIYAKPMQAGSSPYLLSTEEIEALHQAGCAVTEPRSQREAPSV